jgi:hypothetical protein
MKKARILSFILLFFISLIAMIYLYVNRSVETTKIRRNEKNGRLNYRFLL